MYACISISYSELIYQSKLTNKVCIKSKGKNIENDDFFTILKWLVNGDCIDRYLKTWNNIILYYKTLVISYIDN